MKLLSLNTVGIALIALALVMPTGAITGAEDPVWEAGGVVLSPADGPNGEYAEIDSNGNLSVDLASVGINPEAVTVVGEVFTITNQGDRPVRVWVTHDGADAVTVFAGSDRRPIQGNDSAIELMSGESIAVGFRIDSRGHDAGETLMRNLQVHARRPAGNETTPTPAEPAGGQPGSSGTATPTETPDVNETVEVIFDVSVDNVTVEVEVLDGIPPEADRDVLGGPRADIQAENVTERTDSRTDRRFQSIVLTNTTVTLDGRGSLLSVSDAIDRERRIAKVVRITPPEGLEDTPATIRMRISKAKLAGTDPANARIGHRNETGWQLLPTRVIEETDDYVLLETRTPGFSVFAVWRVTDVEYYWDVETIGNRTGETIDVTFAEPGIYNATLTVEDALGQTDTTDYRILANDRPDVDLRVGGNVTPNAPLNLTANVSDEFGNTTVTWKFEDGTSLVGRQVARSFEPGRHVIEISVEDEYGAARTREFAITVPEPGAEESGSVEFLNASLSAIVQSAIVGGLGLAILILRRRIRPEEAT